MTTGTPGLMMPPFSAAMASMVSPSSAVCSSASGVITLISGVTRLVASSRPPNPTSSTTVSTWDASKQRKAIAVSTSKVVTPSIAATWGRSRSTSVTKLSSGIGSPPTRIRSRGSCRCGDVYSAVRCPAARSTRSIMAAVEPFPFVPATCTTRSRACGSPSRAIKARMRSSL